MADTGEEALALLEHQDYDMIFMDIGLLSGIEVASEITPIPIIALTAHAKPETEKACLTAGMQKVVTVKEDTLQQLIAEVLASVADGKL